MWSKKAIYKRRSCDPQGHRDLVRPRFSRLGFWPGRNEKENAGEMKLSDYPKDWKKITEEIRIKRAKNRCECRGHCALHVGRRCKERHTKKALYARGKVVLTTA